MPVILAIFSDVNSEPRNEFPFDAEDDAKAFAQVIYEEWWEAHKNLWWYMGDFHLIAQSATHRPPVFTIRGKEEK